MTYNNAMKIVRKRGQAALIALLVLTIATTVGLSLIARSTTDVGMTRTLEESSRAFSAAEAGVELALQSGVSTSSPLNSTTQTSYNVSVTSVTAGANSPFTFSEKTPNQNTETIWLVPHNSDGSINDSAPFYTSPSISVCWSSETTTPAMVVTMLYKRASDGTYQVAKGAYDPSTARAATDKFAAPTATTGGCGSGTNTTYKQTITFSNFSITATSDTLIALRLRPVYSPAQIAVVPGQSLPTQGNQIVSVGQTASGVVRKIIVYQEYPSPGTIFDAAVYSEGSFSQ